MKAAVNRTGKFRWTAAVAAAAAAAAIFLAGEGGLPGRTRIGEYRDKVTDSLAAKLAFERKVPGVPGRSAGGTGPCIYVLGGNQDTLVRRFRKAAELYHGGVSRKILILSRPGITEFSPELGRNFTNDEWGKRELEKLDVRMEDVEAVPVRKMGLGTLSEARNLPDILRGKGCRQLILVTSKYHTRRTYRTFAKYASENGVEIFIYGSDDDKSPSALLVEYAKYLLYDELLIPAFN